MRSSDVSVGHFCVVVPSLLMHEGVVFFLDVPVISVVVVFFDTGGWKRASLAMALSGNLRERAWICASIVYTWCWTRCCHGLFKRFEASGSIMCNVCWFCSRLDHGTSVHRVDL